MYSESLIGFCGGNNMNLSLWRKIFFSIFLLFSYIMLVSTCFAGKNKMAIILVGDETDLFYANVIKKDTITQLKIMKRKKRLNYPGVSSNLIYYDFNKVGHSKHWRNILRIKESYLPLLGIAVIDSKGNPVAIKWRVRIDNPKKAVSLMQRKLERIAREKDSGGSVASKGNTAKETARKNKKMKKERLIVVHGYAFRMRVYEKSGDKWNMIREYPVGIGKNGMGKTKSGDKKTPLGQYKIIWKASRFWKTDGGHPIIDGKAFCGPKNIFTTDPNVGYSSEKLWTSGYGGKKAVVMCLDYPNSKDRSKGYTGGCIEIHATLLGGIGKQSSMGCIRMRPADARELYNLVDVGTMVILKER